MKKADDSKYHAGNDQRAEETRAFRASIELLACCISD